VGLGVTGVMLYVFTVENLWQFAVLSALGATPRTLLVMTSAQSGFCALLGTGIGVGLCAGIGRLAADMAHHPFRLLWFTPVIGGAAVVLVSLLAAALSALPVRGLQPMVVFERR